MSPLAAELLQIWTKTRERCRYGKDGNDIADTSVRGYLIGPNVGNAVDENESRVQRREAQCINAAGGSGH